MSKMRVIYLTCGHQVLRRLDSNIGMATNCPYCHHTTPVDWKKTSDRSLGKEVT